MIADCEKWKLSTPECHLFWPVISTCERKTGLSFLKGFISEDPDFYDYLLQSTELLQTIRNSVELFLWLFLAPLVYWPLIKPILFI